MRHRTGKFGAKTRELVAKVSDAGGFSKGRSRAKTQLPEAHEHYARYQHVSNVVQQKLERVHVRAADSWNLKLQAFTSHTLELSFLDLEYIPSAISMLKDRYLAVAVRKCDQSCCSLVSLHASNNRLLTVPSELARLTHLRFVGRAPAFLLPAHFSVALTCRQIFLATTSAMFQFVCACCHCYSRWTSVTMTCEKSLLSLEVFPVCKGE